MSTTLSTYDTLIQNLLLPSDIREIVEGPLLDRGYPLNEYEGYDVVGNRHVYVAATYKDQKIVLLHLLGEIIADYKNFKDVFLVANLFTPKSVNSSGLFFFARVKDLNPDFNNTLAVSLAEDYTTIKAAHFFHQGDIDSWKAKPLPMQKRIITNLLALDTLLPGNGSRPAATVTLDLTQIQDRVVQLLYKHYEVLQGNPRDFYISIRNQLSWPPDWMWEPKDQPLLSAQELVKYLVGQAAYPPGRRDGYRPLGALLYYLIRVMGGEDSAEIYQIIVKYRLIDLNDVLNDLKQKYCPTT